MSKNKYLIIIILLGMITLLSAQVDTAWTRRWSSPGAFSDYAYVMTADGDGNVYAAGSQTISSSSSRAQVIKYNTAGDILWRYTSPNAGTFNERASSIVVAPSGNVYITGYTMRVNAGDYLTIKLNGSTGDSIWTRTYDFPPTTTGYDFARRIAIDASENVYVTGYGQRSGTGSSDYGTVKYDSDGVFQWASFYDGGVAQTDQAYSIATDGSGVYVTGYSNPYASGTLYDIITIKYNAATGDTAWIRKYNGPSDSADYGRDIAVDGTGNVYIAGTSKGSGTGNDFVTIKYTSTGDTAWLRTWTNPDTIAGDAGWWVEYDPSGCVYVYGNTTSPGAAGGQNLCLVKYNASNGNVIWVKEYNGPNVYEICPDETGQNPMALDASGNIYLAGTSRRAAPSTRNDIIAVKYNSSGVFQWEGRYDYYDSSETAKSIAVDNAGNVYVSGHGNGQGTYIDWVTVKFTQGTPSSYVITATAYGPGTITPSGAVVVPAGHDTTFAIAPNPGNRIDSVVVDNANQGAITNYTFYNVSATHTIKAYFSANSYTITASAFGGGTITPSGSVVVPAGHDTSFAIAPDIGYHIDTVLVDGGNQGTIPSYTFYSVSAPHTITAYFSINFNSITATADAGGIIIPSGVIYVPYGADTSFTIIPDSGYQIADVIIDGDSYGPIAYYEFLTVIEPHTIHATFVQSSLVIIATASPNGTITPSGTIVVNPGDDTTFTITPDNDCQIDSVLVDGISIGPAPTYTFYDISISHTIHAMFSSITVPGWNPPDSFPTQTNGRNIKDGGAILAVPAMPGEKLGGYLYAFKGNKSNEFYRYTLNTGVWQQIESLPFGKKYPDTTKINKKKIGKGAGLLYDHNHTIYALRGNGTFELWAYDITLNTWTQKAFVPSTKGLKGGTSMTIKDGKIYLLAGGQKVTDRNFFVYDPATNVWSPLNSAPTAFDNKAFKDGSCITILNDVIYALKGGGKHNYFSRYSAEPAIWSIAEAETIPLQYPTSMIARPKKTKVKDGGAMTNDGNDIYAVKGGGTQEFWKYTPGEPYGTWTALDTIPKLHKKSVIKTGAALSYLSGIIYILKGNNTLELWKYKIPEKSFGLKLNPSITTSVMLNSNSIVTSAVDIVPNPFTKSATIRYTVPVSGKVTIKLYDAAGKLIETFNDSHLNAGSYSTNLSSKNLTKGVYFLRYEDMRKHKEMKLIVE
jgi:hypothetical protein